MPLYDKRTLLTDFWPTVARRRMPPIHFWNEALHGVAEAKGIYFGGPTPHATSFPMPLCSAASFNESLWTLTGEAVRCAGRQPDGLGLCCAVYGGSKEQHRSRILTETLNYSLYTPLGAMAQHRGAGLHQ